MTSTPSVPQSSRGQEKVLGDQPSGPERRQLTALFCDLVGSTELATLLDPEDLRDVLRQYQSVVTSIIKRHNGFVARHLGDAILAYYSYPAAQEDDVEQAIRSALAIVKGVRDLSSPIRKNLQVRIGIATGTVIVGDVTPETAAFEKAMAHGSTLHLAARLEQLAPPNGIIVCSTTRRLAGDQFAYEPLGAISLRGFAEKQAAWVVKGEPGSASRFHALRRQNRLSPLLGREPELALLSNAWRAALDGAGQALMLVGEAGIGKSRLAEEFIASIASETSTVIRLSCGAAQLNTAFHPVVAYLNRAAGILAEDSDASRLDKLVRLLAAADPATDASRWTPYFAALLGIADGSVALPPGTPEQQRDKTLAAVADHLATISRSQPTLVLLEDLHWIDPSSAELVSRFLDVLKDAPTVLVMTARPGATRWTADGRVKVVDLGHIGQMDSTAIVRSVAGDIQLPASRIQQIAERAGGIPLFIEELTRSVAEGDASAEGQPAAKAAGPSALPSTLLATLEARLDRLGPSKAVAQACSVIGREFSLSLLQHVLGIPAGTLDNYVDVLSGAGLLEIRGGADEAVCRFRHALFQEAAYGGIMRGDKRRLHGVVAEQIQTHFPLSVQHEPHVVAHHLTEAGERLQAIPLWQKAGVMAAGRAAHVEATVAFEAAIALLDAIPDDIGRIGKELELRILFVLSHATTSGYAAPRVEAEYARAREICTLFGNPESLYTVVRGLCTYYIVRANVATALQLATECEQIANRSQRPEHLIEADTALGYVQLNAGDLDLGRQHLIRAVERYRATAGAERLDFGTSQDPAVACLAYLAIADWAQGNDDLALKHSAQAVEHARAIDKPFSAAYALTYAAMLANLRSDYVSAEKHAEEAAGIAAELGFQVWAALSTMQIAYSRGRRGLDNNAIEVTKAVLIAYRGSGAEASVPLFYVGLSDMLRERNDVAGALQAARDGIAVARQHGENFFLARLQIREGELLALMGEGDRGLEVIAAAMATARDQGAFLFEREALAAQQSLPVARDAAPQGA